MDVLLIVAVRQSTQKELSYCKSHDFDSEEGCIVAFISPLTLSEKRITMMLSNIQMELIDLNTNSSLKTKLYELSSAPNSSDMIQFWRSLPCE